MQTQQAVQTQKNAVAQPMETPEAEGANDDNARRALTDMIGESRFRAVRVALFAELLHRPDPDGLETDKDRAANLTVLQETVGWLERAQTILTKQKDPWDEYPDALCASLEAYAREEPEAVGLLCEMAELSRRVAKAAERGSDDLGVALRAHHALRRGPFIGEITKLCGRIWSRMEQDRETRISNAMAAMRTTRKALERMEQIATHVRLVAINAAIEANKLGDEGRGIAFIAAEFKSLAEELQNMSATARGDIATLGKQ
ncbi:hypothetical protein [Sagittula salina]|uniref:Methyl-accepting transducer domain-containing protein n=1 Tax=Sagittula salina TaxID=2820268 RepID=A0A940RZM2_9RHOB|nr:hypothetical protein [Sagittula salina]MBP0481142.1 hypothetical protein [Sagittula salina]